MKEPAFRKSTAREYFESICVAVILALFVRTFLVQAFKIPTGSMEDTLLIGDFLLVNKAVYGAQVPGTGYRLPGFSEVDRRDIVVFLYPDPNDEYDPDPDYVKRVVGVPGDTLGMRDKVLYVNGEPQDEPYTRHVDYFTEPSDSRMLLSVGCDSSIAATAAWRAWMCSRSHSG